MNTEDPNKKLVRIFLVFLSAGNIVLFSYLFMLAFYNRMSGDDYLILAKLHQYGFNNPFTYWYKAWMGRFSELYLMNTFTLVYQKVQSSLPYVFISTVLFISTFQRLLKAALSEINATFPFSGLLILNLSCLLFLVFVSGNFEMNSFYFLGVSVIYFWGILYACIGVAEIISRKNNFSSWFILVFSSICAGSSVESYSCIFLMLLGLFLGYKLFFTGSDLKIALKNDFVFRKTLVAFSVCLVASAIMFLAPGNQIRIEVVQKLYPGITVPMPVLLLIPASIKAFGVLVFQLFLKIPFLLVIAFPFIVLGSLKTRNILFDKISTSKLIGISVLIFIVFIWISILPNVAAQGNLGPKRTITHIYFFAMAFTCFISFIAGQRNLLSQRSASIFSILAFFILIIHYSFTFSKELPLVKEYAQSDKDRIHFLLSEKMRGTKGMVEVDSLFSMSYETFSDKTKQWVLSGISSTSSHEYYLQQAKNNPYRYFPLMPNEISTDTSYYNNQSLRDALELPFYVKVKGEKKNL